MMWKIVLSVCTVVLLTGVIIALGVIYLGKDDPHKGRIPSPHLTRVTVMTVPQPQATQPLKAVGTVEEAGNKLLISQTAGRVVEIMAKEGEALKKGDPVIRLDDTEDRNAYQNIQLQLAMAQAELQLAQMGTSEVPDSASRSGDRSASTLEMDEAGGVVKTSRMNESWSEPENAPISNATLKSQKILKEAALKIDTHGMADDPPPRYLPEAGDSPGVLAAKSQMNQILAKMQDIQESMDAHTLVMPLPGRLADLKVKEGDFITAKAPVAEIATVRSPKILCKVALKAFSSLKEGQPVLIHIPSSYADLNAEGEIQHLQPADEIQGDMGWVKVVLTQGNSSSLLKNDLPVELTFQVAGAGNIWIPQEAVQIKHGHSTVFVVDVLDQKTVVLERAVVTGDANDTQVEIKEGLEPGERIVLEGTNLLEHKQQVAIMGADAVEP